MWQKKEIVRFYIGTRFDNRQVNNFLVNQEVMSTCKNKGRSKISMVWVPRSGLIHIARVSSYHYKMINLHQVSTQKKKSLQKL